MPQIIKVRLTPNAKHNKIEEGTFCDENGNQFLKIYVTAVPEDGKANKALIKLLSKEYNVAKSNIQLVSGEKSRLKTIAIS